MQTNTIPEKWIPLIEKHTYERTGLSRKVLNSRDFPLDSIVEVNFPDGSTMKLKHAFFLTDEDSGEIAIFTEHCGYFFYKMEDLEVKMGESD